MSSKVILEYTPTVNLQCSEHVYDKIIITSGEWVKMAQSSKLWRHK